MRKRVTIRGNRRVVYSSKREAKRAKKRAPGSQIIYKTKKGWVVRNRN